MTEIIYINEKAKSIFQKLGCGVIDTISIYRKDGNKLFFRAGNGRFHIEEHELDDYKLA